MLESFYQFGSCSSNLGVVASVFVISIYIQYVHLKRAFKFYLDIELCQDHPVTLKLIPMTIRQLSSMTNNDRIATL